MANIDALGSSTGAGCAADTDHDTDFQPGYKPDWERYVQQRRLRITSLEPTLVIPHGFPAKITSTTSWHGSELESSSYVIDLSTADLEEIRLACLRYSSKCGH